MYCKTINGKEIAEKIKLDVSKKIIKTKAKPGLAVILVGEDKSSHLYVTLKKQACDAVGIDFHKYYFDEDCNEQDIIETINFLNTDSQINSILVQLPLPTKYNTKKIISQINYKKDVDGFHLQNIKKLKAKKNGIVSPLALGVQEILKNINQEPKNKKIVILCNHKIFAEPFNFLFGDENKIFVYTPNEKNLVKKTSQADILIVAIGKPLFITNEYVKKDAIVIDVGINKLGKETVGDVDFEQVIHRASYITPVPGGIGPMTIAMLLTNTLQLYIDQNKHSN